MLHPDIIVKKSQISERGLFAKRKIPEGTIVYRVHDDIRVYTKSEIKKFSKRYRKTLTKFANEEGNKIIHHLDNAKYGNHSCNPNSHAVSSGYKYMDIALRDIQKDEELTWDYSILFPSWKKPFKCKCGAKNCIGVVKRNNHGFRINRLKKMADSAQNKFAVVNQPILSKTEKKEFIKIIKNF